MYETSTTFYQLAERARLGDERARTDLRSELEHHLRYVVRRVIRTGEGDTPLTGRILAELDQLVEDWREPPLCRDEGLVRHIAHRVTSSLMDELKPGSARAWSARDTVRG